MIDNNTGYAGWQWLELDADDQQRLGAFRAMFNNAAEHVGIVGYEFDLQKASLTISNEEARSGAFHNLAGGEPFYRISMTAAPNSGMEGLMTCMMLSQAFATAGGASVSMGDPAVLTLDRRNAADAIELIALFPQAVKQIRKSNP